MRANKASTVTEYLRDLEPERRAVLSKVRNTIRRNLPKGYQESMTYGIITYAIPLDRFSETYNGQPLCYAGLAAQKNHFALYLMRAYGDRKQAAWLASEFRKRGRKLDMGKSCIRFKRIEDLPLDVIGEAIASTPVEGYIEAYRHSRAGRR
jgi:hypothetical protein